MNAAIVKLNPLPDAIRPAAQNHDLAARGGLSLVLFFIRRVEVWRKRLKLCRARIHAFEYGPNVECPATLAHLLSGLSPKFREVGIGESILLGEVQHAGGNVFQREAL